MRRPRWHHLVVMLMLVPGTSSAIQLHWSSGADTLTFTEAIRCTLVVEADPAEGRLPAEWRLLWVADTSAIQFIALDPADACSEDVAQVSAVDLPVTPADSAANLITAHFCSGGTAAASRAEFIVDLPAPSRGKVKVVALNPADSSQVIGSNEVTFNGSIGAPYPPALLRAVSNHETALLRVTVMGTGLSSAQTIGVGAPDGLWNVPLAIVEQEESRITATADVPVPLPEATVRVATSAGACALAPLPADQIGIADVTSAGNDTVLFCDPEVGSGWYPKDFAFLHNTVYDPTDPQHPWKGLFHLFYIRANRYVADSDTALAHGWSQDLVHWTVDTAAFRPRHDGGWDDKKVWAPSIVQIGNLYYMFYTGVDPGDNQSIGYATTGELGMEPISWDRPNSPVYRAADAGWAWDQAPTQFRDPFVMQDPDQVKYPGRYLLFNAGRDAAFPTGNRYAIGVARNRAGTLDLWDDRGHYEATDYNNLKVPGALESPLVVRDSLTGAWRMFVANADYPLPGDSSTVFITQTVGDSLTDTRAIEWQQRDWLYHYVGQDADVIGWQACEHLQIGDVHFFAAFEGNGIGITRLHWDPDSQKFFIAFPSLVDAGRGPPASRVRFYLSELRPTANVVRFRVESPGVIAPQVTVYDVAGRRVRKLTDGRSLQERGEVTWDCRDEAGHSVATGIYFARMTGAGQAQVVRVPIIR